MIKDALVSMEDVKLQFKKQILEGPLKVFFLLVEKGHTLPAVEIIPLVKESLENFSVNIIVPQGEPAEQLLRASIDGLDKTISALGELVSQLLAPQIPPPPSPEVPGEPVPSAEANQPTA